MHGPGAKLKSLDFTKKTTEPQGSRLSEGTKGPTDIPQWYRERQLALLDAIEELGAHQKDTNY